MSKDFDGAKIITEYEQLADSFSKFCADALIYEDFYDGNQWRHENIIFSDGWNLDNSFVEDGIKVTENHCDEVVDTNVEILMNYPPSFRVPKPQEVNPFMDEDPYAQEQDDAQTDRTTDIEKVLRLLLKKTRYHRKLANGACDGCQYGRTLFLGFVYDHKHLGRIPGFKDLDPTKVRFQLRTGSSNEIEKAFFEEFISLNEAKDRYKDFIKKSQDGFTDKDNSNIPVFSAKDMAQTGWQNLVSMSVNDTDSELNPKIRIIHCYDSVNYYVVYDSKIIYQVEHKISREAEDGTPLPPVWFIANAPMGQKKNAGQSDIKKVMATQVLINKLRSFEYALVSGFTFPSKEVISNRAEILNEIRGNKSFDIRLIPGESINFKTPQYNNYPLSQSIGDTKQHLRDESGMTNAVFGDPSGSINTGPALKIQYNPAERKIMRKTIYWIPEIQSLYSWMLKVAAQNPKFAELISFNGEPWTEVEVCWDVKTPQDESVEVSNDINLVDRGIISKETVARNHGVKNTEYEFQKIAMEKIIDAKIKAEETAGSGQGAPMGAGAPQEDPAAQAQAQQAALQSTASADKENYQMASGQQAAPTDPASVPDFDAHNQRHLEFINSQQFQKLPDGVKKMFAYHLQNAKNGASAGAGTPQAPQAQQLSNQGPILDRSQNNPQEQPMGQVPQGLRDSLPTGSPKRNFK